MNEFRDKFNATLNSKPAVRQLYIPGDAYEGEPEPPAEPPLPLVWYGECEPALEASDFVEGLLTEGALSVIYGDSNTGKTFVALDKALHVAAGLPWFGRDVEQGGVLYLALEGGHGIRNRICAFRQAKRIDPEHMPFAVVPVSVNLLNPTADTSRVIDTVKAAAERMGRPVKLIVVDTLSRAMAGGNENSAEDMTALVGNADRIRDALRAHVQFIHHSGKDAARGARGHSSLRAATDTELEVTRDAATGISTVRVSKQRDLECTGEFAFRLQSVALGENRRGKLVTSCVVAEADVVDAGPKLTGDNKTALRLLTELIEREGATGQPGLPADVRAVPVESWRVLCYSRKPASTAAAKRQAFNRACNAMAESDCIRTSEGYVWIP